MMIFKETTTLESLGEGCLNKLQPMADHLGNKTYLCGGNVPCIADFIMFEHIESANAITNTTY